MLGIELLGTSLLVAIPERITLVFNVNLALGSSKLKCVEDCFDCCFVVVEILEEKSDFVVPKRSFFVSEISFFAFLLDAGRSVDASVGGLRLLTFIVPVFSGVFDDMM